jgi:hypothetical protein
VWFLLYEKPGIGKSVKMKTRLVVSRALGERRRRDDHLTAQVLFWDDDSIESRDRR